MNELNEQLSFILLRLCLRSVCRPFTSQLPVVYVDFFVWHVPSVGERSSAYGMHTHAAVVFPFRMAARISQRGRGCVAIRSIGAASFRAPS